MRLINPKINVLLVDDDSLLVSLYKKNAESYFIDLATALNGEEALELIRSGLEPHAILLDIDMPVMNGIDMLRTIRTEQLLPSTDIIVVTNSFEEDYLHAFGELGIEKFIPKHSLFPDQILDHVMGRYISPFDSDFEGRFLSSVEVF